MRISWFIFLVMTVVRVQAQVTPYGKLPTPAQLQWHDDEFYLFVHFGPNTFTDAEWGKGNEQADVFNPTNLNTDQWCRIARQAGAAGIIITAKHHDGFCLWPSNYSTHTVRESRWRNGRGDVLQELSQSCRKFNLKFGVYLSPWDRNHPHYGTEEYNQVYAGMIQELFTRYGPIWEFWWDGANGEGLNGKKQQYDWKLFEETIRQLSPSTVIFSDVGPDIRWCGNENGIAGETNWNLLNITGFTPGAGAPPQPVLNQGNENGEKWIPAECDVSIRPGWFYHEAEDLKVKAASELFDLYLKSVGRGANLLLNVPPNREGVFTAYDSTALLEFKKLRDQSFEKNVLHGATVTVGKKTMRELTDSNAHTYIPVDTLTPLILTFKNPIQMNCIQVSEVLALGQRVKKFSIELRNEKNERIQHLEGTTIGHKRMLSFPEASVYSIILVIDEANAKPVLSEIAGYITATK